MRHRLNLIQLFTLTFFFCLLTLVSCKKETSGSATDNQQEENASMTSGQSDGEAEGFFGSVFDDAMGANNDVGISGSGVFFGRTDSLVVVPRCFTVTITRPTINPFPVKIVVDFGTTGCPGPDGHVRKGKVITEYTNRMIYPGSVATTIFEEYFIDNIKVEGTHKISNIGTGTPLVSRIYKAEVINGKLTKPNGDYTEWNSTKTITQLEGLTTLDNPRDDVFKIEGSARGRVKKGALLVGWESSIIEPLIKRLTCRYIVKGRIRIVRINTPVTSPWVAVLDFGAGNCDNQAVITINGTPHQITLP